MKKSFLAIFSAAAIAVSSLGGTIAYGSVFADINDVPWSGAAQYIDEAYNLGLMAGYVENGQRYCKAKNNVTYCEAVQLMYAIMSEHSGTSVSSSVVSKWTSTMASKNIPSWAYNAVAYALENSILSQNDISIFMSSSSTQNNARREDVAVIFGKALAKVYSLASNPTISYNDKDKVATTSVPYLELLNRLDIMVGDSDNNFNPKVNINRAEMSVIVTKAYNTLKGSGSSSGNNNTSTGVVQYSGKVTEKTSSNGGYSISVVSNGTTYKFTTNGTTKVTDGSSTSSVSKINTGDSIVAVCNNGVASAIIIMEQNATAESTEKGTINSISSTTISLKTSSKTKSYTIANEDIDVTIDGSNSSLSSLVSKFKGGSNFTATIGLNSDDEVISIEAKRGSSDDEYDDDAIVSLSKSKITLNNGDRLDFPDDPDDVSIRIDGKSVDGYDDLKDAYDDLDDDEQMIVDDYELDSDDEPESLRVKIEDKDSSSSSSSDKSGVIKSITTSRLTLESGTKYDFADEDDISSLKIDSKSYDGDELDDFVSKVKDKMEDDSVYVELTIKSSEITKVVATTCDTVDGDLDDIDTGDKTITVDNDDYDYTSSTTVSVNDGETTITSMSKLEKALNDDDKVFEVILILDDDEEVISVTGNVTEVTGVIKSISSKTITLDLETTSKYKTSSDTEFNGSSKYDIGDLEDDFDDDDELEVTITLEDNEVTEVDW